MQSTLIWHRYGDGYVCDHDGLSATATDMGFHARKDGACIKRTATGDVLPNSLRECEATLWREDILPLPDWFKSPDPDEPYSYSCNVGEVGAWVERSPDSVRWYWSVRVAPEPYKYAKGKAETKGEAMRRAHMIMRAVLADELTRVHP